MAVRGRTLRARSRYRMLPALAGLVLAVAGLAACGGDSSSPPSASASTSASSASASGAKKVRIAMVGYDNKNNYTQWWWLAAQDEAKKVNADVTLVDGKFDAKAQAAALQNTITSKKFDAIALLPVDGVSALPIAKEAGNAGLKVVTGATLGDVQATNELNTVIPQVDSVVGQRTSFQAEIFAKNIKDACDAKNGPGAPCKVGIMPGAATFPTDALQFKVVKQQLAADKNITFSVAPDGGYARPGGYKSMTTFLQSHKDTDVLHADGDQMIAGAVQAIKEAGLTPGKDIYLTGYGGTIEGFKGIADGTWFATVVLNPQTQARKMVDFAAAAVRGQPYPKTLDLQSEAQMPGVVVQLNKKILDAHPGLKGQWSEAAPH
jgi:galactofuranose transport system substrate-binding protein